MGRRNFMVPPLPPGQAPPLPSWWEDYLPAIIAAAPVTSRAIPAPPPPSLPAGNTAPPSPTGQSNLTPPSAGGNPSHGTQPPPSPGETFPPPPPSSDDPKAPGPPQMSINASQPPYPGELRLIPPPLSSSSVSSIGTHGSSSTSTVPLGLAIGIAVGAAAGFFALILFSFCYRKKKRPNCFHDCESPKTARDNCYAELPQNSNKRNPTPANHFLLPHQVSSSVCSTNSEILSHGFGFFIGNFTFEELAAATGNFSEANLLGEGGFGYVHRGFLPTADKFVAIKQLKDGSRQGDREFLAEVETITRVHHKHLVSLVGYCVTGVKRLLVYEFVPNRTLDFHLHGQAEPVMDWPTRLKIAIGSAKGLAYLHEDCNPTIIHRDIKGSNILLDSKFEAKVSDFGLAKIFPDTNHSVSHVSTRVVGTFGYLAPEYAQSGKASNKSDVFSYGVVLLELITGRLPIMEPESSMSDSLVSWARPLLRQALEDGDFQALVDPRLQGNYNSDELVKMVACSAACVRHTSWRRPQMSQIVRVLEGDVSLADLDEGFRPGQSSVIGFLNHNIRDISKLGMTFQSQENAVIDRSDSGSESDNSSTDSKSPLQGRFEG